MQAAPTVSVPTMMCEVCNVIDNAFTMLKTKKCSHIFHEKCFVDLQEKKLGKKLDSLWVWDHRDKKITCPVCQKTTNFSPYKDVPEDQVKLPTIIQKV